MAKQDSTLSFNNYSTDVDESQMVIDLLLNPQVAQEPEYATYYGSDHLRGTHLHPYPHTHDAEYGATDYGSHDLRS